MERLVIIGNSGGGKSTLARRLADKHGLPCHEVDGILWQPGWVPMPVDLYEAAHARMIAGERWIIEGLGRQDSIARRMERATDIVLIDLPLWVHFWLSAERQITWATGQLEHPPAGLPDRPPTEALFRTINEVDRVWMPDIRALADQAERAGRRVQRIQSIDALTSFGI